MKMAIDDRALATVRWVKQVRRARSSLLSSSLFSDPAWEILLQLYEDYLVGRVSSVRTISASHRHLSDGSIERWSALLGEHGMLMRPQGQLMLTCKAVDALERCFEIRPIVPFDS